MITVLREGSHARDNDNTKLLRRIVKEPFQKIEWFVGVALKVMGERMRQDLETRDDKVANIANMVDLIASMEEDVTNAVDLLTSKSRHKEIFWDAWRKGWESSADHGGVRPGRIYDEFEQWYKKAFPNNISSLQKPTNELIQRD